MTRTALLIAAFGLLAAEPQSSVGADLSAQEVRDEPVPGVTVRGVVVDHETGDSLSGGTVSLGAGPAGEPGRGTRVTGEGGRFVFEDVPPGTYSVIVRLEGYRDMNDTLRIPPDENLDVVLPLSTGDVRLRPEVKAPGLPPVVPRWEQRRRGGARYLVTREEIEERRPRFISELLHRVPGGMVVRAPPYGYTLLLRGQCQPGIWVDGVELVGVRSIDQAVTPHDVEALEVFHAFEFPVEYGVNRCGGILVWTRSAPSASQMEGDEPGDGRGIFGRLLGAAVIVAVMLLLTK